MYMQTALELLMMMVTYEVMETVHADPHVSTKQFCSQTLLVHSAS